MIVAYPSQGGIGNVRRGSQRKSEGQAKGFPDLAIYVPVGPYHGAFIELKREHSFKISPEQKEWGRELTDRGYAFMFAFGLDDLMEKTQAYFRAELTYLFEKTDKILGTE